MEAGSRIGGRGREVSCPGKISVTLKTRCWGRALVWKERCWVCCAWGSGRTVVQASGLCWTGRLASCWGIVGMDGITRQGSGAARWELTLWDHHTVFLTMQYCCFTVRLCGPWGGMLEHRGDLLVVCDFRRSLVFNRHTECTGMQDVQFCTMKNYSGIFLISKYPTGHSYRWKIYF